MRNTSMRVVTALVIFLLSIQSAFASADEARKVFDSLFAAKIKAVTATGDRSDDIALGKEMLAIAKTSEAQPELLALLCDQVHDLCIKHADGFATAVEAQQLLADQVETKRTSAQEKLTTLLTRQMTIGKADEREGAGESLIALLISMGDEKFEKKQYAEAAGDYRRAVTVATQRKSVSLEEAKAKLEFAAARDRAVKNLARLQEKLLKDANDFATAEEIVKLYVIELDDPAGAVPFLNRVKDEQLKTMAGFAAREVHNLDKQTHLDMAQWYRTLAGKASATSSKELILMKSLASIERFLELHVTEDLDRKKAALIREQIKQELAPIASVASPKSKVVDLLALIDPAKDSVDGTWLAKDGKLLSPRKQSARIAVPVILSGDYVLQIKLARVEGEDCVVVVIPVGPSQACISIDTFVDQGCFSGLETIEGKRALHNATQSKGRRIQNNQSYTLEIEVSVRGDIANIRARLDGKALVTWEGRHAILGVDGQAVINDRQKIGLMVWDSVYSFQSIRLSPKSSTTIKRIRD